MDALHFEWWSHRMIKLLPRSFLLLTVPCFLGSSCLPATNPHDPSAPLSVQARGALYGRVILDNDTDYGGGRLALKLKDATGEYMTDEAGQLAQFETRESGATLPEGLEGDALGTFEILAHIDLFAFPFGVLVKVYIV